MYNVNVHKKIVYSLPVFYTETAKKMWKNMNFESPNYAIKLLCLNEVDCYLE